MEGGAGAGEAEAEAEAIDRGVFRTFHGVEMNGVMDSWYSLLSYGLSSKKREMDGHGTEVD